MYNHYTTNCVPIGCVARCRLDTGYSANDPRSTEPTAQNAFIGSTTSAVVLTNGTIPLTTVFNSSGTHIQGTNPITLRAGHKYSVSFTVIGKPALAVDFMGAKLRLNGVDVAGSAVASEAVISQTSVTGGAIVTVPIGAANSLTLVGLSTTSATYSYASIRIVEVE